MEINKLSLKSKTIQVKTLEFSVTGGCFYWHFDWRCQCRKNIYSRSWCLSIQAGKMSAGK